MKSLISRFDKAVTKIIMRWPKWLVPIMRVFSLIGYPIVIVGLMIAIGIFGFVYGNNRIIISAIVAGIILAVNCLLKIIIHRTRPAGHKTKHLLWFDVYSFPSGHTSGSTVTLGLLAYLLLNTLISPLNFIITAILVLTIIGIGLSRVYVGAHYPTDVLVGWMLGLTGLIIITEIIKPLS